MDRMNDGDAGLRISYAFDMDIAMPSEQMAVAMDTAARICIVRRGSLPGH